MKIHRKINCNVKVCHADKLGYHVEGQVYNQGSEVMLSFCNNLESTEANFAKLYTKVYHN